MVRILVLVVVGLGKGGLGSWGVGVDLTGGGGGGGRPGCVRSDGDLLGGWQSSRVAWNHHDGRTRDDRCLFHEELSVAKGDTTRTIHSHNVLVELSDLNDHACLVPFSRVGSSLVLDPYSVADSQWWEDADVFGQPLSSAHMSIPQCFLPGHEGLPPDGVGLVLAWVNLDEVADGAIENAHGWEKVGVLIRGVSVLQHGTLKLVGVQRTLGSSVICYEALDRFDSNFRAAVGMWECY